MPRTLAARRFDVRACDVAVRKRVPAGCYFRVTATLSRAARRRTPRLERRQVVGALAEADQLDRHAELALYGDHDAALGGAVELGQHDAGDVDDLAEDAGLDHAVLAGGRVEDEQHLGDRRLLLDHPLDLAELVHQALLVLQPAGGVDDDGVDAALDALP